MIDDKEAWLAKFDTYIGIEKDKQKLVSQQEELGILKYQDCRFCEHRTLEYLDTYIDEISELAKELGGEYLSSHTLAVQYKQSVTLYPIFRTCGLCGNKRCPKATHHEQACTQSNETNQPGSSYGPSEYNPLITGVPYLGSDTPNSSLDDWF